MKKQFLLALLCSLASVFAAPTITIDSTYSGYAATAIDDGVINAANWAATWASDDSASPHWIALDFGQQTTLTDVTLHWTYNSQLSAYMTSQEIQVQSWTGSAFQTVATFTRTANAQSTTIAIAPTTSSQFRIYQPANKGNPGYVEVFWITELDYTAAGVLIGDVNGDGTVDVFDITMALQDKAGTFNSRSDLNSDGQINVFDLVLIARNYGAVPSTCTSGQTRQCGTTDVGTCSYGTETCTSNAWGSCVGAINPATEVCGGGDEDCDGQTNEGCSAGPATYPNKPAGMTTIFQANGSIITAGGKAFGSNYFGAPAVGAYTTQVADASDPSADGQVIRIGYSSEGPALIATANGNLGGPWDEIYFMTRLYFEGATSNWSTGTGSKVFYFGQPPDHTTCWWLDWQTSGEIRVVSNNCGGSNQYPNSYSASAVGQWATDQWLNIELRAVKETSGGARDGKMQVWINDVLVIDRADVPWSGYASTQQFGGVEWYSPDGAPAYTAGEYSFVRLGEWYMAGKNTPVSTDPQPSGTIRFDTRAGGAQSIQAASTVAQANSAASTISGSNIGAPYVLDLATGFEYSSGGRAWRFNWRGGGPTDYSTCSSYPACGPGIPKPCYTYDPITSTYSCQYANNFHEHDMGVEKGMNNVAAGEVYAQWKLWMGKTTGGGGVGQVGDFIAHSTHGNDGIGPPGGPGKRLVWHRAGSVERFTLAGSTGGNNYKFEFVVDGHIAQQLSTQSWDWDQHTNEVVTMTLRIKPETVDSANDGILQLWMNGQLIHDNQNANVGTAAMSGAFQIGGPTWIGPYQDQTMYLWDVVVWQP